MNKITYSKGIIQLTPLIIGLLAGLVVAGVVGAFITKNVNLGATARLIVSSLSGTASPELGVKFYNGTGNEINSVSFGELRDGDTKEVPVKIKNTGNVDLSFKHSGNLCGSYDVPVGCCLVSTGTNGLSYHYGVNTIEGSNKGNWCSRTYDFILHPNEEMEIRPYLTFEEQDTTGKSDTDINFNYEFEVKEK